MEQCANILLLGKTGVGKSTFINYLFEKDICVTGAGKPVTQNIYGYINKDIVNMPIRVFDSKGLEVANLKNIKTEIINFVNDRCNKTNIYDWIHTIFYCINLNGARLEDKEIEFIQELQEKTLQVIHIIITHCDNNTNNKQQEMISYIKRKLEEKINYSTRFKTLSNIKIYCVNSVEEKTRRGIIKSFGRENILNDIYKVLWENICQRISIKASKIVAKELRKGIDNAKYIMYREIENRSRSEIVSMFDNNSTIENTFDQQLEKTRQNINNNLEEYINSYVNFFNQYTKNIYKNISVSVDDYFCDDMYDYHIDKALKRTNLGKLMEEIDKNNDDVSISFVFKAAWFYIDLKDKIKEVFREAFYEISKCISEEKIQKQIYMQLVKLIKI